MRSDLPHVTCPECGAENNTFANACWICRHPLYETEELVVGEIVEPTSPSAQKHGCLPSIALVLLILAALVVGFGVLADTKGGVISFAIFVVPLIVGCGVVIYRGSKSESKTYRLLSDIFSTLIVTVGAVILLGVASIIALLAYCLMLVAGLGGR